MFHPCYIKYLDNTISLARVKHLPFDQVYKQKVIAYCEDGFHGKLSGLVDRVDITSSLNQPGKGWEGLGRESCPPQE